MEEALKPGAVLSGRYRVESLLGAGGMGQVYRAHDQSLRRAVAIKILPANLTSDASRVRRFVQEAQAASSLNHPNVLTIHEVGVAVESTPPVHFIVTELVEGQTLRERINRGKRDLRKELEWMAQVASGLAKAHAAGIIHRDVKPENLMVTNDGHVKILDFGLAKLTDISDATTTQATDVMRPHTSEGVVMGTASYLSPEQAEARELDHRSDIFSTGVVLYELVARRLPFHAASTVDTLHQIVHAQPKPLTEFDPSVPFELQRIVKKCLAKSPDDRYQSATELAVDLRALAKDLDSAPRLSGPLPSSARRRTKAPAIFAIVAAVAVIATVAITLSRSRFGAAQPAFEIQRITNSGRLRDAAISPDGRYLAYSSRDKGQSALSVLQIATATDVQIAPAAAGSYGTIEYSRDGNYLYYTFSPTGSPRWTLFRRPVLGGSESRVLDENMSSGYFAVSPDEKTVAFFNAPSRAHAELRVASLDGGASRIIAIRGGPTLFGISKPAWSPDSKKIAFMAGSWEPEWNVAVFTIDVASRKESRLTHKEWHPLSAMQLAWTPDGSELALAAAEAHVPATQLWLIDASDGEAHRVTHDLINYSRLSLTSDGKSAAAIQQQTDSNLYVVPVAGGEARQITFDSDVGTGVWGVDWAPDGRIIYAAYMGDHLALRTVDHTGANNRILFDDSTKNRTIGMPAVSPDGRFIAACSDRSGPYKLWLINADGTSARMFLHARRGVVPAWSPDGRWIVYGSDGDDVWRVDASHTDAIPVRLTDGGCFSPEVTPDSKSILCTMPGLPETTVLVPMTGGAAIPTDISANRRHFTPDGQVAYRETKNGATNIFVRALSTGSIPKQITHFTDRFIEDFAFSPDGKEIVVARSESKRDAVLIRNFR